MCYRGLLAGQRRTVVGNEAEYDALHRLTQAAPDGTTGGYTQTFGYNAIGNIISTSMQGGYGYAPSGTGTARPHAVITTSTGNSYTYDANGNMLTRPGQTLTWDADNRLSSVTQGGVTTAFTYNGDGQRVKVTVGNVITAYVGSLYEVNPSSGLTTTYYYLNGQRVAMRTSAGVTWLAGDHLGSASLATNSAGQKVSDERYYPYGATRSGSMPTDYQFTGQKRDTGTGLYYYGARYYDPATGRFISADSIVPKPGKPQALNRYSYVYNNPMRFVDPTGMFTEEELISMGAYTADELTALAEQQPSWYACLMAGLADDSFILWGGSASLGAGTFRVRDGKLVIEGSAYARASDGSMRLGSPGSSAKDWGGAVGNGRALLLAPDEPLAPGAPNPHIQLSPSFSRANAGFVFGWDTLMASGTTGGWSVAGISSVLVPLDPSSKAFGLAIVAMSSAGSTLTLADTLFFSGPNSVAFGVNLTTYLLGLVPFPPLDLAVAWIQVGYDGYSFIRGERNR